MEPTVIDHPALTARLIVPLPRHHLDPAVNPSSVVVGGTINHPIPCRDTLPIEAAKLGIERRVDVDHRVLHRRLVVVVLAEDAVQRTADGAVEEGIDLAQRAVAGRCAGCARSGTPRRTHPLPGSGSGSGRDGRRRI